MFQGESPGDLRPRITLAALAVGAGAIHLAMVPAHLGEWALEGWAFLATAWIQLGTAFLAVSRPSRRLWLAVILLNGSFVAAWGVSRTTGFPIGPHKGVAEPMSLVDVTCVLLELALIVGALGMISLPLSMRSTRSRFLAPIIAIAVLGLTTGVLASPGARNHVHSLDDSALGVHAHDGDDKGLSQIMNGNGDGHAHEQVAFALDPATQVALDEQLAVTREVAKEYPTLQYAKDAGYRRAGPYIPGLALHMIKFTGPELNDDGVMDDENLRHPLGLLYESHLPNAKLVGFMYYSTSAVEPTGFVGRNDSWHYHEQLCAVTTPEGLDFPFGPDLGATPEQCASVGGNLIKQSQWMMHVWTVPGYEISDTDGGTFAEVSPALACSDHTYYTLGYDDWATHPFNVCRSGASGQP